jgi:CBS domain protein
MIFAIPLGVLAAGIAGGSGKYESEDKAQYESFNPHVRPVREAHAIKLSPVQTTKTTQPVVKGPEKGAVSGKGPGNIILVGSVMIRAPYYCRESQSVDDALQLMRELDRPSLPVLDNSLRVVGVVSMIDLMRSKKQKDAPPSPK